MDPIEIFAWFFAALAVALGLMSIFADLRPEKAAREAGHEK